MLQVGDDNFGIEFDRFCDVLRLIEAEGLGWIAAAVVQKRPVSVHLDLIDLDLLDDEQTLVAQVDGLAALHGHGSC